MTIPLVRCDQVVNRVIKQEFIDDTENSDDNQLIQTG